MIKKLVEKLEKYSKSYYEGSGEISDSEFDTLEDELRKLDPENPWFSKVREGQATAYGKKRKHLYSRIGSIDKIKNLSESKLEGLVSVSAKLDGSALVVYFKDGNLLYALTRGDGAEGFDVTANYLEIVKKYNLRIPEGFTGAIRGEVLISNRQWTLFKQANPEASMQRNTSTGILNRKETTTDLKYLDFVIYEIVATNQMRVVGTVLSELERLDLGYPIAPYINTLKEDVSLPQLETLMDNWSRTYPLDGLVFNKFTGYSDNLIYSQKEAFKFEAETKEVIVKSVTWNLQKSGKYIPLVNITPTEISGALVRKATGFNYSFIRDNNIGSGAVVAMMRSGEVIPYVSEILKPATEAQLLHHCRYCGSELVTKGVDIYCFNKDCEGVSRLMALHFLRTCGGTIKGAGESIYQLVLEDTLFGTLTRLAGIDLRLLTKNQSKLIAQIRSNIFEGVSTSKLIEAANFEGVGAVAIKNLVKHEKGRTVKQYLETGELPDKLPKIGPAVRKTLIDKYEDLANIKHILTMCFIPITEDSSVDIKEDDCRVYCVTGSLSMGRKAFSALLKTKNWVEGSIGKAEVLITENINSGSSKAKEAIRLGKKVMTEKQFMEELF